MSIRYLTAGDSHGEALVGIVEGLPAGVKVSIRDIQRELMRRRRSYGRSSRQMVEKDEVAVISGLWKGRTTGAPVAVVLPNRARVVQGKRGGALGRVPRPGHADLAGMLKYGHGEIPPVSERASARSTAMRVAVGALAKAVLTTAGIAAVGHVTAIGEVLAPRRRLTPESIRRRALRSSVFCADASSSKRMVEEIQHARGEGNSLGGSAEVIVTGAPPGLGSHVMWDRKLDARLAGAMMSIQSVKAVEIGDGMASARRRGVDAHDAMTVSDGEVVRESNHAGGIEGGMTNGEDVVIRVHAKPIPTARRRARTFDMKTLGDTDSPYVRSDVCVIPALSVIAEAVAAWEILDVFLDKFGGDTIAEALAARDRYLDSVRGRFGP
jgi:chorismate synthase